MRAIATVLAVLAVLAVARADIWSNCGTASDTLQNIQISVTPNPPKKGQDVSVSFSGNLQKTITSGNIHVEVSFLGIKVINQDKDLCEAIAKYQPCPLNAGPQTAQVTQSLPSSAPSGHYTGKAKVTDQDGSEVACVNLDFNLN